MKILIVANTDIVFARELSERLESLGYEVYLLDFARLELRHKGIVDETYAKAFKRFSGLSKIHMVFRMYYISQVIKSHEFDWVNLHFSRWIYILILKTLGIQKLLITIYGSDFYRASFYTRLLQKPLYEKADKISFMNPQTRDSFLDFYKDLDVKTEVCRFGSKTLEYIEKNRAVNIDDIKRSLGYKLDKKIVSCGYNATRAQQHIKIIDTLMTLPEKVKNKIQFIFLLTYGDMAYKDEVKRYLEVSDLDYFIVEEFLYEDANAYVKLASDLMINVLQTDSFSGSMQEFLYAQNSVITGSWLPYELFESMGIVYEKIDRIDQLNEVLISTLNKHDENTLICNKQVISNLSSWDKNILKWIALYEQD